MAALAKIRSAGFNVQLLGESFQVSPAGALTSNQRSFLKSHKAEIMEELRIEAMPLSVCDQQKLLTYLDAIDETDQVIINEYLTECGKDSAILAMALQRAEACLQIKTGDYTGLVQCSGCRRLSGDACQLHVWRVVVDKWRRCSDFDALHKTSHSAVTTCKGCSHFQCYNDHGGGAGACSVGVQPFGLCWWADTHHECQQFNQKAKK